MSNVKKLLTNKINKDNIEVQLHDVYQYLNDLNIDCIHKQYTDIYTIQCFLSSKLKEHNTNTNLISMPTKDFPDLFHTIIPIGSKSKQGDVFLVTFKHKQKYIPVILKYGKDESRELEIVLHEVSIGFFLNHLRADGNINFMYTYTPFYCSTGKKMCTSTKLNNVTTCAFFEYIKGDNVSNTFKKMCKQQKDSISLFIPLYLQIALALADAQAWCKYMHYDLHDENIMIVENKKPVDITYKHIGYKLKDVEHTGVIIDYGNSILLSPTDKTLFIHPFIDAKIKLKYFEDLAYTKNPFISCYDIFHFCMMCLSTLASCNDIATDSIKKCWKICMTFFIHRLQHVTVSKECKDYLTKQRYTPNHLYYRLSIEDKELVNIDLRHYLEYLIHIIQPSNLIRI